MELCKRENAMTDGRTQRITIVTVSYNAEELIEETILSVVGQTYSDIEYLIFDGGSTDNTVEIIKKYSDRIDYWQSVPDDGIYDAMNKALKKATGAWINFLNAGDRFVSQDVLASIRFEAIEAKIIFGKSITCYGDLCSIRYEDFETYNPRWYLKKMPNHQAIFVHKTLYRETSFDLSYTIRADTLYLRRLFESHDAHETQQVVSLFELGGRSNFYRNFKTYKNIITESIRLDGVLIRPIVIHTFKFVLQKILGMDRYMQWYIRHLERK
jgi:glycosyltransferase involved in cell wall biosynthesis